MANVTASEIAELNEKFSGIDLERMFATSLMGFPRDADSGREIMFSSEVKQIQNIKNPDFPRISTGHENMFGKISHPFKAVVGDWKVVNKIVKSEYRYTLVLYNEKTDTYDMVEKKIGEALAEKFGYQYNTEVMDSVKVGTKLKDGTKLYKSYSLDKNDNYCLGKNTLCAYMTSTATIEDAVKIRRGCAEQFKTSMIQSVEVPINDNDIPLLIHGNKEDGYRALPNLGEELVEHNILCATRRLNSSRALFDLNIDRLREALPTDDKRVVSKHTRVYDVTVYYNNHDKPFPDNEFFSQLKEYYDASCRYADELKAVCAEIKSSGSHYTKNVTIIKSWADKFNDPTYTWKNSKGGAFNNISVVFKTVTESSIEEGSKVVGRYGDKGVVSKITDNRVSDECNEFIDDLNAEGISQLIAKRLGLQLPENTKIQFVPDDEMPWVDYPDGPRQIDIILNASGAIRRLNCGQLYEVEINFMLERFRQYLCTLDNEDFALSESFEFMKMLNPDEGDFFAKLVNGEVTRVDMGMDTLKEIKKTPNFKHVFLESLKKDGFYINKGPSVDIRFDELRAIYKRWPDVFKLYKLHVKKFGMVHEVMHEFVVGEKYMYVLKQTTKKNYSARSTGRITKAGIPAKSSDKKDNRIGDSNSPIRIGEVYNLNSQISGADLALHNVFTRTSAKGRRKCFENILAAEGNPLLVKDVEVDNTYVNANAVMLKQRFKQIGIGYKIITNQSLTQDMIENMQTIISVYGLKFIDTPINRRYYVRLIDAYNQKIRAGYPEKDELTWETVLNDESIKPIDPPEYIVEAVKTAIQNSDHKPCNENDIRMVR